MATPFCPADIFDFPLRAVDLFDIPRKGQEAGATREKVETLTAKSFLRIICRECIIYLKYMVLVNTDYLHSVSCIIHSLFIEMSLKNCQICIPFNLICFFVNTSYGSARRVVHVLPSLVPFQSLGCRTSNACLMRNCLSGTL